LKSLSELSKRPVWLGAARAFLFLGLACPGPAAPSEADASAFLDRFRQSLWAEPTYLEFDLRQMPRRGDEHVFHGRLWGAHDDLGSVTRIEVDVGAGGFTHRFLIRSGPEPAIWVSDGQVAGTRSDGAGQAPLAPGLEMTPFDVQMPYLYWLDVTVVGVARIRGRPAFNYVFTPPADFTASSPGIGSVRVYLDTQYDALVQSEVSAPGGNLAKTLSLLELRKVGDRWIPKDVDVRNEATRDKTRLSVTAVAVAIAVDPAAFDPSRLGAPLAKPPQASVRSVAP
jgi:Outer membrane lipoprotein-sorting protein